MYQKAILIALGGALALLALIAWQTAPAQQQPVNALQAQPKDPPVVAKQNNGTPEINGNRKSGMQLPITQVILFSSGVGYFQREGEIENTTRVDLSFQQHEINDLLKSMILQDLGGGRISTVSYDSHDPIDKTLRSFAVNLNGNPSFGEILNQCRGEKVEVTLQQSNTTQPGTLTGTVLGMEAKQQAHGPTAVLEVEMLNLSCAEGLRTVKLNDIQRVRLLNPVMDSELKRALDVLALSHDMQKKAVSLLFAGDGKRNVRVGYVVENPIWKTSYRLVLDKDGKPYLQGWAVVENSSDDDWSNVQMKLVSGRPISFQMDLYQPLFIPRPTVEPELFASLRPPTYSGALTNNEIAQGGVNLGGGINPNINPGFFNGNRYQRNNLGWGYGQQGGNLGQFGFQGGGFNFGGGAGGFAGGGLPGNFANGQPMQQGQNAEQAQQQALLGLQQKLSFEEYQKRRNDQLSNAKQNAAQKAQQILNPRQGVASAASAEEIGDFFQYSIDQRVTLPRQKSALLPVVNKDVEGTKVSIYNENVQARFPLLGLKLKNTTGQHLMQGPVSVFEGGSYAGDARVMDLHPKEERLISYAIDLGTEVKPDSKSSPDVLTAVKVVKGILHTTHKLRQTKTYQIKNRTEHDRTLIIEHPVQSDWKLVTPEKPAEQSRDFYRFQLPVAAGKSVKQEVVEEQTRVNHVGITNSNDQAIRLLLTSTVPSGKVKEALSKAIALRTELAGTQREVADLDRQLKAITEEQVRLRANLERLPRDSAAYKRYLTKFDTQETEIEKLQEQIKKLQETAKGQQKEYEDFLTGLTVE